MRKRKRKKVKKTLSFSYTHTHALYMNIFMIYFVLFCHFQVFFFIVCNLKVVFILWASRGTLTMQKYTQRDTICVSDERTKKKPTTTNKWKWNYKKCYMISIYLVKNWSVKVLCMSLRILILILMQYTVDVMEYERKTKTGVLHGKCT